MGLRIVYSEEADMGRRKKEPISTHNITEQTVMEGEMDDE